MKFYCLMVSEYSGYRSYIAEDDECNTMDIYPTEENAKDARVEIEKSLDLPLKLSIAKVEIIAPKPTTSGPDA